jgi:hypothetical protein
MHSLRLNGINLHYAPGKNLEHIDVALIETARHGIELPTYLLTDWHLRGPFGLETKAQEALGHAQRPPDVNFSAIAPRQASQRPS